MRETFKVGDKVYFPIQSTNIHILQRSANATYPLMVCIENRSFGFTEQGKHDSQQTASDIFPATEENHKKLTELCGMEFEEPARPKSSREVIQAMLDDGWEYVPCMVTDTYIVRDTLDNVADFIVEVSDNKFKSLTDDWRHAFPIDPKTGKIIINYVDGQIITE